MKDKMIVYLKENGYGISSLYGKIMFKGQTWKTLNEATKFCKDNGLDYQVA